MNNSFSFSQAFSDGFDAFKENAGLAIGGILLIFVVSIAISIVPIIGPLASLVVSGPLTGGYVLFFLKLSAKDKPEIADLFSGFNKFGLFLGIFWMLILISLIIIVPIAIGAAVFAGIMSSIETGEPPVGLIAVGISLGTILMIVFYAYLIRYAFVYFVAANETGDGSILGSFKESARITEGVRLKLFGCCILLSLFYMLGYIALIIGALVTLPIAACAYCHIYLQLQNGGLDEVEAASPAGANPFLAEPTESE